MGPHKSSRFHRITLSAVLVTAIAVLLVAFPLNNPHARVSTDNSNSKQAVSADFGSKGIANDFQDSPLTGRVFYPYSVIPGGVENARELVNAIKNDPVVSAHYGDFDAAKANRILLDQDRFFYTSYRMGEEVFWTKRPLLLHKGESLITDGVHEARSRCGNRLSRTPQAAVSINEPPEEAFESSGGMLDAVNPPIDNRLEPPISLWAKEEPALNPMPPVWWFYPGIGNRPTPSPKSGPATPTGPNNPPTSTPEPSTVLLLSGDLAALWGAYKLGTR